MALKPSQDISRHLTRPHKATNRARLMLTCINQCMYNFQQNLILPSSCRTQLLLNQSMQFFISHTKLWHRGPCLPKLSMPLSNAIAMRPKNNYGLASTIQHFILSSLLLFTQFHSAYNSKNKRCSINHRCPSTSLEGLFSNHAQLI